MKLLSRIILVFATFFIQFAFFPQINLGFLVALYLLLFVESRESYFFAIFYGLLLDLFIMRIWGISTTLIFILLLGAFDFGLEYIARVEKQFRDYLVAVVISVLILQIPNLLIYQSLPSIGIVLRNLFMHIIIAGILYILFARIRKIPSISAKPMMPKSNV